MRTLFGVGWGVIKLMFWAMVLTFSMSACVFQLGAGRPFFIWWAIMSIASLIMIAKVIGRTLR